MMSDLLRYFGGLIAFMGLLSFAANDRMFNANAPHENPLDVEAWVRWVQIGCVVVGMSMFYLGVWLAKRPKKRFNPSECFPNYVPIDHKTPLPPLTPKQIFGKDAVLRVGGMEVKATSVELTIEPPRHSDHCATVTKHPTKPIEFVSAIIKVDHEKINELLNNE